MTARETIVAVSKLFNMGADLAAFLTAGAVALNGDIQTLTYSIGGADARKCFELISILAIAEFLIF